MAFINKVLIEKFIKFGLVGLSGLFVDFGITYLLKEKLKVQQYVSNAIGFITAASSNYILNRIWTFKSENPNVLVEYSEFFMISLVGLALNSFIVWLLVSKFKRNFYFSKLIAIFIVTIWNFAANLLITFK